MLSYGVQSILRRLSRLLQSRSQVLEINEPFAVGRRRLQSALANERDPQKIGFAFWKRSLIYLTLHVAVVLEWQFFFSPIPNL
jgi:hypothetical protein